MSSNALPPSLAVAPNIPLGAQTIVQLEAERDYWAARVADAAGPASAAAERHRQGCVDELQRRGRR